MRTKTVRLQSTTPAVVVEVNRQEGLGWAVRHIVQTADGFFVVVFERDN